MKSSTKLLSFLFFSYVGYCIIVELSKMEKVLNKKAWKSKCNTRFILDWARRLYLSIAIVVVSKGFYSGYNKLIEEDISYRQENKVFEKMRYPSVTFCYKYNHGSKKVMDNYLPMFYEIAQKNGN